MNWSSFVKYVRMYSDLAQRKHHSYANTINMLLDMRSSTIEEESQDDDVRKYLRMAAAELVQREYVPVDRDYRSLPTA